MTDELPRLAVFWEDAAFSPLEIAQAARGTCRPVYVVGWAGGGETAFPAKLLRRLGEVVDIGGSSGAEVTKSLEMLDIGGVAVFTDTPMRLAATVAQSIGLPFHSPATARLLSDKGAQRQALAAAGVPVPGFWPLTCSKSSGHISLPDEPVRFPAVLKPRRGSASRDTFFVTGSSELRLRALQCRDEDLLLEEYIADCEPQVCGFGSDLVSVETLVDEGEICHVAITGRFAFTHPFRDTGGFLPSDLPADQAARVCEVASAAARALGVTTGALHTEIKLSPSGPVIVEVNGRVGGNVPDLLHRVGGPALISAAMTLALGLPAPKVVPVDATPVAFVRFFRAPFGARRVREVSGLDEVRRLPGISRVGLDLEPGAPIEWGSGPAADHVAHVSGVVPDHDGLAIMLEKIDTLVQVSFGD